MKETMKRIAPILVLVFIIAAVGAYFVHGHFESRAKEKARQEKKAKLKESTRAAIKKMASKFDAIDDWDEKLSEGSTSKDKKSILTMEVEKLWLTERPILFVGRIDDVANADDPNAYSITMTYSGKSQDHFDNPLALAIKYPKALFDSFLKEHPKALSDVAVIGKISKIENHDRKTEEGEIEVTKVGIGLCLDLMELPPFSSYWF